MQHKLDENGCKILDECGAPIKECCRPVVDNCGNAMTDCDGAVYEKYAKHERKLGHYQETYATALGGWMHSHGVDPLYVQQQFGRAVEKVVPNGIMEAPRDIVNAVITPISGLAVPAGSISSIPVAGSLADSLSSAVNGAIENSSMYYRNSMMAQPL